MMKDYFQKHLKDVTLHHQEANKKANTYSLIRGILFLTILTTLIAFLSTTEYRWWWLGFSFLAGIVFYQMVLMHLKWLERATHLSFVIRLYKEEIQRLDLNLNGLPTGIEFQQEDHPYHIDLDIFGKHSLFQLLNRCQLPESRTLLAKQLSLRADIEEIHDRQEAVQELGGKTDWMLKFQAVAGIEMNKKRKDIPHVPQQVLVEWSKRPSAFKSSWYWKAGSIVFTLISIMMIVVAMKGIIPYQVLYLLIPGNGTYLIISMKHLHQLTKGIDQSFYLISAFEKTISLIENEPFTSKKLEMLRKQLATDDAVSASHGILGLRKLTHRIAGRSNMLYQVFNALFLLDAYLLTDLYRWKEKNKNHLEIWMGIINEMECLISLAGFARAHPEYSFPVVDDAPFHFDAKALGHPLIPSTERVSNDYTIKGKGSIDIITGSNMSGKSTFQRTLGINIVLAQMGAPVAAVSLSMGLTHVFASMRTIDDLSKHTSSFYAELKRIRQLLDVCGQNESTFFVLDELLKGTNSEDRHKGAVALIVQLAKKRAFGIVSTHDLALGRETATHQNCRNFSFNSEIKGEKITFDYQLTPGLCKSFNASKLMEQMGIIET